MNNKFGELIRLRRLEKDISLRKLAERTDISFSHLSKLERGEHTPSKDIIGELSVALDLSEYDLLILAGYQTDAEMLFWTRVYTNVILDKRFLDKYGAKDVTIYQKDDFSLDAIKMRNNYIHGGLEDDELREIISEHFLNIASNNPQQVIRKTNKIVTEVREELGKEYLEWIALADRLMEEGYTPEAVYERIEQYEDIMIKLRGIVYNQDLKEPYLKKYSKIEQELRDFKGE